MKPIAWIICAIVLIASALAAFAGAHKGLREGRKTHLIARLKSPTTLLFSAYLLVASLLLPVSPGESASPLLGLSLSIPLLYTMASLAALGSAEPKLGFRLALAFLFFAAALAMGAILLALYSPAFVPAWLK